MNTIQRPRKRPRVSSCSFRALVWLIRREATYRVVMGAGAELAPSRTRVAWVRFDGRRIGRAVAHVLKFHPERRYYP